jgi:hypothetical protein
MPQAAARCGAGRLANWAARGSPVMGMGTAVGVGVGVAVAVAVGGTAVGVGVRVGEVVGEVVGEGNGVVVNAGEGEGWLAISPGTRSVWRQPINKTNKAEQIMSVRTIIANYGFLWVNIPGSSAASPY